MKKGWRKRYLGELVINLDNKRIPLNSMERDAKSKDKLYPYIGANNILEYIGEYIFDGKILCVAEDGGSWGTNERCANIYNGKVWVNNHAHVLVENGQANLEYLRYFLNSSNLNKYITGTTRGKLTRSALDKVEVFLPENKTHQIRIATLLSQAEDLIQQRKESLRLLDELLRGAFLEMFGDPVRNEKGWEMKQLQNIAKARLGKMLDKDKPKGTHLRKYLANFNVQWFKINFDTLSEMYFLDRELKELELKFGDLLICEGGEVGRTAIWKNEVSDIYFQKAIHRVRPDFNIVTSEYLAYFFWFTATKTKFKKIVGTSTISHLTGEKLDKIPIPIPPLNLQKEFSNIVKKAEILRGDYQTSLKELENLYASLSQWAFKGELDLDFEVQENKI